MDDSSSDIETRLPNLGGFQLDEVATTTNRRLRQVERRVVREAAQTGLPLSGFSSSAAPFDETSIPGSRIPPSTGRSAEESAEFQQSLPGFSSTLSTAS
ncbi:hypothetical protein MXD62_24795 [Frankia sp. Mgl5]|uniref:hypothetical protein n=1 Tax=Frankia sp. Mgl5 TaxID=2933793 RepID=UPI002010B220|nr:hypothetical protein [Frankia sp. Mgl5]MCK9930342.1 hypothetical protein [Frankia sp. Mgl5]